MWNLIIFLIVIGTIMMVAETFLPGGIFGFVGFCLTLTGVVLTYKHHGMRAGHLVLTGSTFGAGALIYVGLKAFPNTRFGKMVILDNKVSKEKGYDVSIDSLKGLEGKIGTVYTDLRPAGIAIIDDKRVDVVSEGGYIEKGTDIKIARIDGNRVLVVKV